ncbi:hypothetical protein EST38_g8517 [Candolleomyces aberdarensis]|uniref:Uncharacterized protein n=1 Tax=Candolleomyces aberdarensis TaxID=2316362 RepID=A0A4Q2DCA1_9AGAR|nr:hypothetical protein EST38_g8517 [Candolleomyces aberdarensis]
MLSHRGFSAWITVDGTPLPEYLVAVDEQANRVSCWIPGEAGKAFTVWWSDHGGKVDTCSFITLDGLVVPGRFLLGEGIASRSGVRSSHLTERPFMFTKVTEDAVGDTDASKQDVGTIVVKIKRVNRVDSRPANAVQQLPTTSVLGKRKAGELSVGFGAEQSTFLQYSSTWKVTPHDKTGSSSTKAPTFVSFVFRIPGSAGYCHWNKEASASVNSARAKSGRQAPSGKPSTSNFRSTPRNPQSQSTKETQAHGARTARPGRSGTRLKKTLLRTPSCRQLPKPLPRHKHVTTHPHDDQTRP